MSTGIARIFTNYLHPTNFRGRAQDPPPEAEPHGLSGRIVTNQIKGEFDWHLIQRCIHTDVRGRQK